MLIDPYKFKSDPLAGNVVLLLRASGGTLQELTGLPVVSVVGGGAISTAQARFGTRSFRNPGTAAQGSNYIRAAHPTLYQFPGEFTFEGWFYITGTPDTYNNIFTGNIDFSAAGFFQVALISTLVFLWNSNPGPSFTTGGTTLNAWHHIAVTRNAANVIRYFVDGTLQVATGTIAGTLGVGGTSFDIGRGMGSDNGDLQAYMDEIRITKSCRYTASFTPPSAPFPYP